MPAINWDPRGTGSRVEGLGWRLPLLALVVVGSALLIGLAYKSMAAELTMLALGGALFILGRWLRHREG